MTAKDVIRTLFRTNDYVMNDYLKDLGDADLLVRPVPGANHIAWQLGHLLKSEAGLLAMVPGASAPELPPGWKDQYAAERSKDEGAAGYLTKAEYLAHYQRVRANSLKALDAVPDADLDKPTEGRIAALAPTIGALLVLIANHPMMHLGQFTVVRRKLGKPVAF